MIAISNNFITRTSTAVFKRTFVPDQILKSRKKQGWWLAGCRLHPFEDRLFRGFAYSWGVPSQGVSDLRVAKSMRPGSATTRLLLSQALYAQAQHVLDDQEAIDFAKEAVQEASIGSEMLAQDNPFAASTRVHAIAKLYQLYKTQNGGANTETTHALENLQREISAAEELQYHPQLHHALVMADTVLHPETTASGPQVFRIKSSSTIKETQVIHQRELVFHYANGDYGKCGDILDAIDDAVKGHISYLMLIRAEMEFNQHQNPRKMAADCVACLGGPRRDLEGCMDWVLFRLVGADNEASMRAKDFLRHCKKYADQFDGISKRFIPICQVMASGKLDGSVEELLLNADTTREYTFISFRLGVLKLANGNRKEAKELFEKVVNAGFYEMADDNMSRAFLMRIHDDKWLPWLPNDHSLEGESPTILEAGNRKQAAAS